MVNGVAKPVILLYWWNRELTLKCKLKCYVKPMKDPLGVSPSKGNHGTTRGKETIVLTSVGIEPTTSELDLPLLCYIVLVNAWLPIWQKYANMAIWQKYARTSFFHAKDLTHTPLSPRPRSKKINPEIKTLLFIFIQFVLISFQSTPFYTDFEHLTDQVNSINLV